MAHPSAGNTQYNVPHPQNCDKEVILDAYGGQEAIITELNCAAHKASSGASEILGLPMTGLDLVLIFVGGAAILCVGLLVRHASRSGTVD